MSKLDGMVDELQPAIAQVEPLLRNANQSVEALTSDLVEVNGVLRDVSAVSGAAGAASNAVSGIADAASEKVGKLFGRSKKQEAPTPALKTAEDSEPAAADTADDEPAAGAYYTYTTTEEPTDDVTPPAFLVGVTCDAHLARLVRMTARRTSRPVSNMSVERVDGVSAWRLRRPSSMPAPPRRPRARR